MERGNSAGPPWIGLLDLLGLLVFAMVGAMAHDRGVTLGTVAGIAWPFLIGAGVGWAVVRSRSGRWPLDLGAGITVWALSLILGLLLRALTGGGVAVSFVLVAAGVTALIMLGWRVLYRAVASASPPA